MTWNSMRSRPSRRLDLYRGRRALVALLTAAGVATACNTGQLLDVKAPDRVPAEILDDPKQAALMVNSAVGDFECAFGAYVVVEGLISDELADAQLGAAAWPYDRRDANTQPGGIYGGNPCTSNQNPGIYTPLSTARWSADAALTKLQAWTDEEVGSNRTALIAKAALYAGLSYSAMGMSMCSAAFDLSAPIDQQAMFARAEERFTTAIAEGTSAGETDIVTAAYVGRARVRLFQGNLPGAADDAAHVPPGFVFEASAGSDDNRRYNRVFAVTTQFGFYTVDPQSRNLIVGPTVMPGAAPDPLPAGFVVDPRSQADSMPTRAADGVSQIWAPHRYESDATPLPIATYDEAQLILAETQDPATAVATINALRDVYGLPHYTGATDAASVRTLIIDERRRALFAQGFRNYDIERFALPLVPAPGTDYPLKGGTYGNTTCLPLPDIERFNNPNVPPGS
ncbi:MAG: RagB/SusD family nutrient uptake outer membrane protein [Gemmatimonadaceae bacterium]|nr:RagB/SusD family nutrient uptake outer membrane protein [Gemmatimonadaceae bacterium]